MRVTPVRERRARREPAADKSQDERSATAAQKSWAWIAVGVLLLCWIAEASLCAARGF
jgi:hypothetical protein